MVRMLFFKFRSEKSLDSNLQINYVDLLFYFLSFFQGIRSNVDTFNIISIYRSINNYLKYIRYIKKNRFRLRSISIICLVLSIGSIETSLPLQKKIERKRNIEDSSKYGGGRLR